MLTLARARQANRIAAKALLASLDGWRSEHRRRQLADLHDRLTAAVLQVVNIPGLAAWLRCRIGTTTGGTLPR